MVGVSVHILLNRKKSFSQCVHQSNKNYAILLNISSWDAYNDTKGGGGGLGFISVYIIKQTLDHV